MGQGACTSTVREFGRNRLFEWRSCLDLAQTPSGEIDECVPRLFEPSAYQKYGKHFRPQSIFALPEPLVPPMRLLLPPFAAARNR
jgi:hypothetical protein